MSAVDQARELLEVHEGILAVCGERIAFFACSVRIEMGS